MGETFSGQHNTIGVPPFSILKRIVMGETVFLSVRN